ncbi:MAG: FAD synthetase family protein [Deltaproteobacteria bacterium]
MKIYRSLSEIKGPFHLPCVTIGNFDGVHLGHQILFSEVVSRAYRCQGTSVVITFEPHPLKVVCPERGIKLISTFEQKIELIGLANIDVLIVLPFIRELAMTPAETFVDEVLIKTIGVHELVIGYDYAMGRNRQGNIEFLKEQGREKGFPVTVVEPYYVDDMLVSSTKIRELVAAGRMRDVKKLLGRSYQIRGSGEGR